MAIGATTGVTASNSTAATSITTGTFTGTAGRDLLVAVALANTAAAVSTITDTAGNAYTLKSSATNGSGARVELWQAQNAFGGTNAVTVNVSASSLLSVAVEEYSGTANGGSPGPSGSANGLSVTASGVITGKLVVVTVHWEGTLGSPTISDGISTYTPIIAQQHPTVTLNLAVFAFLAQATGSITITTTVANSFTQMIWQQFTNISSVSVDVSVLGTGNGTSVSSGSVTTTNASDVIVGAACGYRSAGVFTPGTGFKLLLNANGNDCGALEYLQTASTGSYAATFGYNQDYWLCALVAFRGAALVTPPSQNTGNNTGSDTVDRVSVTAQDNGGFTVAAWAFANSSGDTFTANNAGITIRRSVVPALTSVAVALGDVTTTGAETVPLEARLNAVRTWAAAALELRTGLSATVYADYTGRLPIDGTPLVRDQRLLNYKEPTFAASKGAGASNYGYVA